jgi:acyl-CoA synthetase (AMP-forming)/AMP-acid ligase II
MLTHRNLLANQRMLASPDGITAEDTYVSWVPLHHDMGLAIALQPVTVGATCVLMSPAEFVQRPRRWLEAIATQRGTVAGGPNFGFLHCLARIPREQRDGLDLSSWDIAFDGAEPVRAETLERFANGFASSGFRPEAPHPIYGLAEATCYVASKARGALPTILDLEAPALADGRIAPVRGTAGDRRRVVGCGAPSAGTELLVVDPEARQPCPPERVGEIWVRGPSVGLGYWRRPNETAGTFEARLSEPDQMAAAAYLRTGDLGFIRDGEVFITGRLKDLIIVNGSNHYPQDIEVTAENAHPSLRPAGSAAFALEGPTTERVGLVVEIDRSARGVDAREVVDTIRRAVAAEHQLVVATVALVRPGAIPRTTSGKVQRALCRARLAAGELARLD